MLSFPIRASLPAASVAVALLLGAGACGAGSGDDADASSDRPSIVVTTSALGDVVRELVGEAADVEVIMPAGTSPHDFQASAKQAGAMRVCGLPDRQRRRVRGGSAQHGRRRPG